MAHVIVGNGILGLTTAYRLICMDANVNVKIIGPESHEGCASLAAAAMFNSFCELEPGTLSHPIERQKFMLNRDAVPHWPTFLHELETASRIKIERGFGTYLINNRSVDSLEDENFDAIVNGIKELKGSYEDVSIKSIPNYFPEEKHRAARAILIPEEGWVNPISLVSALKAILQASGRVHWIHAKCRSLERYGSKIIHAETDVAGKVEGDAFVLVPGAVFSSIVEASNLELQFPRVLYGVGVSLLLETGSHTHSNCIRTPNRGLACGVYSAPQNMTETLIGASNLISTSPEYGGRVTSVYSLLKNAMEQINVNFYKAKLKKVNLGWRPTSEDTIPLIGATSLANLVVATGTKRDGLHCSPVISTHLAELSLKKQTSHHYDFFKPERKPMRVVTRQESIERGVKHMINAAYQHDFQPPKNRMVSELERFYAQELEELHDKIGAKDWGIPTELLDVVKAGYFVPTPPV